MDSNAIARAMIDEQEDYLERETEKDVPDALDANDKAEPGSVSSDTMRPEGLIPAFLEELESLDKDKHDKIVAKYVGMGWPGSHDRQIVDLVVLDPLPDGLREMSGHLLEDLFDALGEYAPDGHYFGSHPGDGSDYGFWPFEYD